MIPYTPRVTIRCGGNGLAGRPPPWTQRSLVAIAISAIPASANAVPVATDPYAGRASTASRRIAHAMSDAGRTSVNSAA